MPIKVKTNIKSVMKITERVKESFKVEMTTGSIGLEFVKAIQNLIKKGISPVEGFGRFQRYSDSYRNSIRNKSIDKKTVSPVNLFLTGEMLESLRAIRKNDKVFVEFTDEKARYHQDGSDKMPMRRVLPEKRGEKFTKRVQQLIMKALKKAIREK